MRNCGDCSACCREFYIAALEKPAGVPCPNLHKQGYRCTIYKDRPQACADYDCAWLRGMGSAVNNKDRPNVCRVLVDRRFTQFGNMLVARSLIPNAAMSKKGKQAIERITRDEGLPCLVINKDELVIAVAGPDKLRQEVVRKNGCLGTQKDWVQNIVAAGMEGRVYPGLEINGG